MEEIQDRRKRIKYENFNINDWAEMEDIKVELIGIADESLDTEIKVVCASFNAG